MRNLRALLAVAVVLSFGNYGKSQTATSRLEGTVQDDSGAVVPGAKVEVINNGTQQRSETTTNSEGRFVFPALRPSEYTVNVEATGFRKAVRQNVKLNVGDTITENVTMEVGSVTESVVVQASEVRVQTSDAQTGATIQLRDIEVLPQLARNPIALAILNTGIQIDTGDVSFSRVNGNRGGSNNVTLDGIEVNDPLTPRLGLAMVAVNTDTVEEFRTVTSGAKGEYGRSAGGQMQLLTRSGTNEFHGALFDYLRNDALHANTFFNNASRAARPKYIQNIFGGRIGGPVWKDKTFFFFNYQGSRIRQEVVRNRTVLSPQLKQGIYRYRTPVTNELQSVDIRAIDPRGIGIDPFVGNVLKLLPDPNNTDVGDGLNTLGFRFNNPVTNDSDQYTVKVDQQIGTNHRIFGRWGWFDSSAIDNLNNSDAVYPGLPNGLSLSHRTGLAIGWDWIATPGIVNELRVGGQKNSSDFPRPARLPEPLLLSNTFTNPHPPADWAQFRTTPYKEATDNVTWIRGSHTFKFGGQVRLTTSETSRLDNIYPIINVAHTFGNTPTVGPTGTAVISATDRQRFELHYNELTGRISDVMVRYYSDLTEFLPAGTARSRIHDYNELAFFAQDDWKLSPRFTLNYAVRWDYFGPPNERNGFQGTLDRAEQVSFSTPLSRLKVVKGTPFYNSDYNNFAPRLGFAWDPFGGGKTSIRASYGMYYDRMIGSVLSPVDLNTPGFNQDVRPTPNSVAGSDRRISDGLPALPRPGAPVLEVPADRQSTATVFASDLSTGYVLQGNFSIQHEVFRNSVVEAGYVTSRGIKLFMHSNVNQARIYEDFLGAFKEIQAFRNSGTAPAANNMLVRLFGSPAAAVAGVGASVLDTHAVGTAAQAIDTTRYANYAAAGIPDNYLRNYPQFNVLYRGANDGRFFYDSLQLSFRRNSGSLRFAANYTFSKNIDNWGLEGNGTSISGVLDWANRSLSRGRSDLDRPHSFNGYFIYTTPFGRGRRFMSDAPYIVDAVLGGWELGGTVIAQSGGTFGVSSGRQTGPNQAATLANFTGDRSISKVEKSGNGVFLKFDPDGEFSFPGAGEVGTSGRNTFRGPRFFSMDASLVKSFRVTETHSVKFRAEAYNVFNNVNFALPAQVTTVGARWDLSVPANLGRFGSVKYFV